MFSSDPGYDNKWRKVCDLMKAGNLKAASKWWSATKEDAPSTHWADYACKVWDSYKQPEIGDSKRAGAAWAVWEEMQERGMKSKDVDFFNMIMKAARDLDNYAGSKKTFETMMKAGVKPNVESIELIMFQALKCSLLSSLRSPLRSPLLLTLLSPVLSPLPSPALDSPFTFNDATQERRQVHVRRHFHAHQEPQEHPRAGVRAVRPSHCITPPERRHTTWTSL
jgi:hypothetical protein